MKATAPAKPKTAIDDIHEQVLILQGLQEEAADTEKTLAALNDKIKKLSEETIPDMMLAAGVSEVTTKEGLKVSVVPFTKVSIPKDREDIAFAELRASGAGDLIKSAVTAPVSNHGQANTIVAVLHSVGVDAVVKESIHYQTLNAWAREVLESGGTLPGSLSVYSGNTIKTKETK